MKFMCIFNINFFYVDKTSRVRKIMKFSRAEPTCYRSNFLAPVPANKVEVFVHSTTLNAPYEHARLDSILELCRALLIESYI